MINGSVDRCIINNTISIFCKNQYNLQLNLNNILIYKVLHKTLWLDFSYTLEKYQ